MTTLSKEDIEEFMKLTLSRQKPMSVITGEGGKKAFIEMMVSKGFSEKYALSKIKPYTGEWSSLYLISV